MCQAAWRLEAPLWNAEVLGTLILIAVIYLSSRAQTPSDLWNDADVTEVIKCSHVVCPGLSFAAH